MTALNYDVIQHLLKSVSSNELCTNLSLVSNEFCRMSRCIVDRRLRDTLTGQSFELIWECYTPSDKAITPYYFASYVATETSGLSPSASYSRFNLHGPHGGNPAKYSVVLEPYEAFSQLCIQANLVRIGPRRGLFLAVVGCFEENLRIKRDFLDRAEIGEEYVFWLHRDDVGVRCRFLGRRLENHSQAILVEESELPILYEVEFVEVMLRTGLLLSRLEESARHESQTALVIGSFH